MKNLFKQNIILLILIIAIVITPLIIKRDSEFEGADGEAEGLIQEISPDYEPWFESLWEPPSGEIESLLFSLQVAIGAGLIGYIFGVLKERRKVVANR
ncbi:energy-coupling factor ABC transporter substrate-binding protein [Tissierella praeacuta]|uniref:energy-coupling factor ABC transporter substrate-binding protein n=1 Tax=Tissierella praeacuta TaxID=43131 RepID=UPI003340DF7B